MENDKSDPVIINNERRSSPLGWIIGVAVVVILVLIFFSMGGFGLFSGDSSTNDSNSINVDTPDSVKVESSN